MLPFSRIEHRTPLLFRDARVLLKTLQARALKRGIFAGRSLGKKHKSLMETIGK